MAENDDQTTPIEPLQLQDQQPPEPAAVAPQAEPKHGMKIALTAVAAAGLVLVSGVTGFAIGHQTADTRHGTAVAVAAGPNAGQGRGWGADGQQDGPGMMDGQQGFGRGVDPDGDNWTGGGRHGDGGMMGGEQGGLGMMGGQQGTLPDTLPSSPQELQQWMQDNGVTSLRDLVEKYGPGALMYLQHMAQQQAQQS